MRDILKYIPGFRSGQKPKMVFALIYYAFSLLMLTSGISYFLFFIAAPFMIFYGISAFKNKSKESIAVCIAAFAIMCIGISTMPKTDTTTTKQTNVASNTQTKKASMPIKKESGTSTAVSGNLKVHYINVGQGDSELIQQGDKNMLIDTGTNASTDTLISYLQSQNIKKIDYLVLTHPHEDHIGGADAVINKFDIGTIYMPKVTTTTKTFEDIITAMKNKNLKATAPNPGDTFKLGEANCEILGPINSNKEDLNTYSIVMKVTFGSNKFMFTGDAQASNEEDMINKGYDLSADVLKVGHHGSHTSTSENFLNKVNPKYAVISCGKNNDYGHPHKETMERLQSKNIPVYRTDESGTIVCTSDGNNITFSCKPGDYKYGSEGKLESSNLNKSNSTGNGSSQDQTSGTSSNSISHESRSNDDQGTMVYVTPKGKKYHVAGCRTIKGSSTAIPLSQAKSEGYTPCKVCNPPQ